MSNLSLVLKNYARENRKNPTNAEKMLWARIRKDQLGVRVLRQKVIHKYIVDFYVAKYKLIIEVDGESHNRRSVQDQTRENLLSSMGYSVIRFDDHEINNDIEDVVNRIISKIKSTPSPP